MSLITHKQFQALIANGRKAVQARRAGRTFDPYPVVKLLSQDEHSLWLLSEIDIDVRQAAHFVVDRPLSEYLDSLRVHGRII